MNSCTTFNVQEQSVGLHTVPEGCRLKTVPSFVPPPSIVVPYSVPSGPKTTPASGYAPSLLWSKEDDENSIVGIEIHFGDEFV